MNQFQSSYSSHFLSVRYLAQSVIFLFIFISILSLLANSVLGATYQIKKQYVKSQDYSQYFQYYSIEPTKSEFKVGEPLIFDSYNDTYAPVHLYWNDRLRCDLENDSAGFYLVGRHMDDAKIETPKRVDFDNPSQWKYNGVMPNAPGICYLISLTCADVGYDETKCQPFNGKNTDNTFHIIP